ncbi:MAG: tetratricopeptide repeat protein, partial [Gemmatimonadota bacterium]
RGHVLRRLIQEFARMFDIDERVPADDRDAERFFSWWLSLVSGRGRLVLVIDGVDRMVSGQQEEDPLRWLPTEVPTNVRLILSASPPAGEDLGRRGLEQIRLTALDRHARRQLTKEFFKRYAKRLDEALREEIVKAPQSADPLYLTSLLEELRVFGFADRLAETARHYLRTANVLELFGQIFDRWERDYDRDRPNLVRETLGLLSSARRGLSEVELLDLLGSDDTPLPRGAWAPLLSALDPLVSQDAGVLSLDPGPFAEAIKRRYADTEAVRRVQHEHLARYFARQPIGTRRVEEQPWHERLTDLDALAKTLADPDLMVRAWQDQHQADWAAYWGSLARHTDPVESLRGMVRAAEAGGGAREYLVLLCEHAASLLHSLGRFDGALAMRDKAEALATTSAASERGLNQAERALKDLTTALELAGRGRAYLSGGRYPEAKENVTRALGLLERMRGPDDLLVATSVNDLGEVYRRMGDPARAIPLHERALRNRERAAGPADLGVAESLNNLGCTLMDLDESSAAEAPLRRALLIRRKGLGESHPLTADGFNNLGTVLTTLGRPAEAVPLHEAALSSRRAAFGEDHPAVAQSHHNLGHALSASGKPNEAVDSYSRSLRTTELIHGPDSKAALPALNNLATQYLALGRRAEAIDLLRRVVRIAEDKLGLADGRTAFYRRNLKTAESG